MPKFSNYCFGRNDRHFCVFLFCFVTRASVWIEVFFDSLSQQPCLPSPGHQLCGKWEGEWKQKNKRHIWQCVHFLNLVGLIFFFLSRSLFFFLFVWTFFSHSFFFFLLLFPWVLLASQGTRIFPQNMVLKAEPLFPATGNERGGWVMVELGWGLTSWLPVQGLCQCEKKQRRLIWWLWKCVCPRERVQLD